MDAEDPEPLDPSIEEEPLLAAGNEDADETPGVGAVLGGLVLATTATLVGRRR